MRVVGQLIFNGTMQMLNAALAGFGLAYLPEELASPHLSKRRLVRVLADWCPSYPGYHLYYPSRRQSSPAFALLVDWFGHSILAPTATAVLQSSVESHLTWSIDFSNPALWLSVLTWTELYLIT